MDPDMQKFISIIDFSISTGSHEKSLDYLKREIVIYSDSIREMGGVVPPMPESDNLEFLRYFLFSLIAQIIALDKKN